MCTGNSTWLEAKAIPGFHVEVVIQGNVGLRMTSGEAMKAARQLLQAAADAMDMNLTLDAKPVPAMLRCHNSKPTPPRSGAKTASADVETSDVTASDKNTPLSIRHLMYEIDAINARRSGVSKE